MLENPTVIWPGRVAQIGEHLLGQQKAETSIVPPTFFVLVYPAPNNLWLLEWHNVNQARRA